MRTSCTACIAPLACALAQTCSLSPTDVLTVFVESPQVASQHVIDCCSEGAGGISDLVQLLERLLAVPHGKPQSRKPECLLAAVQRTPETMALFLKSAEKANLVVRDDSDCLDQAPLRFLGLHFKLVSEACTACAVKLLSVKQKC